MTMIAASKPESTSFAALTGGTSSSALRPGDFQTVAMSLIDRFLAPASAAPAANLTPVQQGEVARASDEAGIGGAIAEAAGAVVDGAIRTIASATSAAAATAEVDHPISVGSTVMQRADGTKVTTVTIDVAANFRIDGGTLPKEHTATTQARSIERSIERDFTKTYRDASGNITRYVTDVHMTVNRPIEVGREQFVLVDAKDAPG